ncbi:hypothetical protein CHLRE_09g402350v5 [Chlamydomonas reinhardtii]|uniref:Uncharacterized protein n=1 Tax=Chlamydomonas reinhardtii TaxID=3055 RepID=A8J1J9_CHLRE|nr:uncharacterized protein CHLRE_09g402350v5 [Chlamydomonas reinhardtii]PNW78313.1 hypothetical protein CHLRE_09g402350v5 [Chlamydomonas reinhardtii]|eukprot:XP_001695116.1 predicted protein [Chlamydomonas reinhardtii]
MADEGPSTSGDVRFTVPTRLKLIVTEGPCEGQIFDAAEMDACFLTLGRTKKTKIHLKDDSISEKHAEFAWTGSHWTVTDTCSSNGTRVNGAKLKPNEPHVLKAGEHVALGDETIMTVELSQQSLANVSLEWLMRAHFESSCQGLEAGGADKAREMVRRCHEALDSLMDPAAAVAPAAAATAGGK